MASKKSKSKKEKNQGMKTFLYVVAIFLFLGIAGLITVGANQGFTITAIPESQALTPEFQVCTADFLSGDCIERSESMIPRSKVSVDTAGEFFDCTSEASGTYIPLNTNIGCEFNIFADGVLYSVYDCPADVNSEDELDSCERLAWNIDSSREFFVKGGQSLFIEPKGVLFTGLGTVQIVERYPAYGLRLETAEGRDFATTESCYLQSLPSGVQTIDVASAVAPVVPDNPFNAVTGCTPKYSSRVVLLNGELVYIKEAGQYYEIVETDEGLNVVDTVSGVKYSDEIECIPSVLCTKDAKIVEDFEDQDVSLVGGALSDYAPVVGDSSKLCRYDVVDGKLSLTDDCVDIKPCDDPEKPLRDPATGECVAFGEVKGEEVGVDYFFILAVGMALLFVIVIVLIVRQERSK